MAAENSTGNTPKNISEEILELEFTEEDIKQAEAACLKEEARLAEQARLEAEAAAKARLDAAWRDMEDKRFEYERMAEEKRAKARDDILRFLRNSAFVVAGAAGLWLAYPFVMQFLPTTPPAAPQPVAQVQPPEPPAPEKDPRGATEFEEGMRFFDSNDFAKAAESFRQSAEQGNAKAQASLGEMYAEGKGVIQDYQQAMSWHLKAAEQGSSKSQADLAKLFADGKGIAPDAVEADKWFQISGTPDDESKRRREEIEKSMTPEQLATAAQKAAEWASAHPK